MTVIDEIAAERRRQIEGEGWSPERDDSVQSDGQLAAAAGCYALHAAGIRLMAHAPRAPRNWPWHPSWWKPKDRRHDLIRAAALIVAEIERLDRAMAKCDSDAR
ncbi:hypothetical protein [Neoroseomonas lacus]|uniref:Uncharacterized protein n=1 Tax=Neoroseomonas lacus TaxID=287609 RepID=A0A917NNG9_9PROT|nr:hypothetical protein [Neoroseomonas lacus]GGJ13984.1 hypothetical protein GCM10011320_21510 [Neoroseomonas lacus]